MAGFGVLLLGLLGGFINLRILLGLSMLASIIGMSSMVLQIRHPTAFGHYGRTFYHVVGGPLLAYLAMISLETALVLLLSLLTTFGSLALLDLLGMQSIFSGVKVQYSIRDRVYTGPTHYQSGTYWIIGALVALAFFELPVAIASILIFTLGDGAAGIVGDLLKDRRPGRYVKTAERSIVFLTVALAASSFYVSLPHAFVASTLAAIVEALRLPIDDNITVPIVSALAMSGLKLLGF